MEFIGPLLLVVLLLASGGFRFIPITAAVWIGAWVFNPPIDSHMVWFIAAVASIIASYSLPEEN